MSRPAAVTGVWALCVFGGGHRIVACLDRDDGKAVEQAAETAILGHQDDAFLALVEAYELLVIPTPKGIAPVEIPYGMVPLATPHVRLSHIQTITFRHHLPDKAVVVFDTMIHRGREQAVAVRAAQAGLSLT